MSVKLIATWVIGAIFLLFGIWIVNNLELTIGVSEFSYAFAMFIALLFLLLAGLCWISVAVGTRHKF
ncbi:unnamed protein product [marine sediment metagenome]|uniref:Uncharacterized protein n=1 Tax=marine sediment metagenome TaxID=412755 RepID=X0T2Y1_9ZZZZ